MNYFAGYPLIGELDGEPVVLIGGKQHRIVWVPPNPIDFEVV